MLLDFELGFAVAVMDCFEWMADMLIMQLAVQIILKWLV
jgi:hypothetical protein